MRPVLAKIVSDYCAMIGGRALTLSDVAEMNDALDVAAENDRIMRDMQDRK